MTTKYNLIRDVSGAVTQNVLPSDTIIRVNVKNLQEYFDIPTDKSLYVVIFNYISNASNMETNKILVEARNYPYPPQPEAAKENPLAFSVPGGARIYLSPARNNIDTDVLVEANIYEASDIMPLIGLREDIYIQYIYIEAVNDTKGMVDNDIIFKAWGVFSDGTTQNVTSSCNWISSDTYIAQSNSPGIFICLHAGQTDIQAEHIATGLRSNFITINVYAISYINVLPQNPTTTIGQAVTFTAIAYYTDGTSNPIRPDSWESSDLSKVSINNYGVATAISYGTSNIYCVSRGVPSNNSVLTVSAVSYIRLIPDAVNMGIGQDKSFMAVAYYTNGTSGTIIPDEWISMYPAIATINSQGVATAISVGITAITARLGTVISVQSPITVVAISYVTIIPTNPAIDVGKTVGFTAIAYYTNDTSSTVVAEQWISTDHLIATIDAQGIATGVSAGTVTISCVYKGFNSLTQTLEVIGQRLVIELLTYPSTPTGSVNSHMLFQAYATYYGGDKAVIVPTYWYSSNPSIATIDENGDAYLHNIGVTNIYCQVNNPDGTIIVSNQQPLTVIQIYIEQLEITPSPSVTQRIGSSIQFNAYGLYSDGLRRPLVPTNWYTDNEDVVGINDNGSAILLTDGIANIYATEPGFNGALVTSNTVVVNSLQVMSLDVKPVDPSSKVGQSIEFNAFATYSDTSVGRIDPSNWESDNQVVATIDSGGYASCLAVGTSNITAVLHQYNLPDITSYPQALVVDANDEIVSLDVTPKNPVITEGGYAQFSAIATYADGRREDFIPDAWVSDAPTILSIDANGYARGYALGVVSITAYAYSTSKIKKGMSVKSIVPRDVSNSTNVTVGWDYISSLQITPSGATKAIIDIPTQYSCIATFFDGSTWPISPTSWHSSDELSFTVDGNGCVTGHSVSNGNLVAHIEQPNGPTIVSDPVVIEVLESDLSKTIVSISVFPNDAVIKYGDNNQFIVNAVYSDGTNGNIIPDSWTVLNPAIFSITANGTATGLTNGVTTLYATVNSIKSSNITVRVGYANNGKITSLKILPDSPYLYSHASKGNDRLQLIAQATYADGTVGYITPTSWNVVSTTGTASLNITSSGYATSGGFGTATINAKIVESDYTVTSSSNVITIDNVYTLSIISLSPTDLVLYVGQTMQLLAKYYYDIGSYITIDFPSNITSTVSGVISTISSGAIRGITPGTTSVRCSASGIFSNYITVTVLEAPAVAVVGTTIFSEADSMSGYLLQNGTTFSATNPTYSNLSNYFMSIGSGGVPKYGYGDGAYAETSTQFLYAIDVYHYAPGMPSGLTKFSLLDPLLFWVDVSGEPAGCVIHCSDATSIIANPKAYLHYYTPTSNWYLVYSINGVIQMSNDIPVGAMNYGVVYITAGMTAQEVTDAHLAAFNPLTVATGDFRGMFLRMASNGSAKDPDAATRTNYAGVVVGDLPGTFQAGDTKRHFHGLYRQPTGGATYGACIDHDEPNYSGGLRATMSKEVFGLDAEFYDSSGFCSPATPYSDNYPTSATPGGNENRGTNVVLNAFIKY